MRYVLIALLMASSPAFADDQCDTFTHESRPPGEVTVEYTPEEHRLVWRDTYGEEKTFDVSSGGTGIMFRVAKAADGEIKFVRRHEDSLIVDMVFFEPYCP